MADTPTKPAEPSESTIKIPVLKRMDLDEFLKREKEHKIISQLSHIEEDTEVDIQIIRIGELPGSEWMKFCFENPVYYPIEKIYFTVKQELMIIAPPFLYIHLAGTNKGRFCISQSYDIECDICEKPINYITTNIHKFYCDDCWEKASDIQNMILVMAGDLRVPDYE